MNTNISFAAFVWALAALPLFSQSSADNPRLKKALESHPEADANKDGVLTKAEAKAFKKKVSGKAIGARRNLTMTQSIPRRSNRCSNCLRPASSKA